MATMPPRPRFLQEARKSAAPASRSAADEETVFCSSGDSEGDSSPVTSNYAERARRHQPPCVKPREEAQRSQKRHPCLVCGKTFTRRYNMKVHERIHKKVNQRPHACDHCGESFKQKSNLKRHVLRRHTMPFSCPRCPRGRFSTKEELVAHAAEEHPDDTKLRLRRPPRMKAFV